MAQQTHARTFDEIARRSNGAGRDAVLVRESGRSFGLYVVQSGRPLDDVPRIAVFLHAHGLGCLWSGPSVVRVNGEFGDVVLLKGASECARSNNLIEIAVPKEAGLSFWGRLTLLLKRRG